MNCRADPITKMASRNAATNANTRAMPGSDEQPWLRRCRRPNTIGVIGRVPNATMLAAQWVQPIGVNTPCGSWSGNSASAINPAAHSSKAIAPADDQASRPVRTRAASRTPAPTATITTPELNSHAAEVNAYRLNGCDSGSMSAPVARNSAIITPPPRTATVPSTAIGEWRSSWPLSDCCTTDTRHHPGPDRGAHGQPIVISS